MNRIKIMMQKCRAEISITINPHKNNYQTVEEYIEACFMCEPESKSEEIDAEVEETMIKTNTVVDLHFYPDTPVGFFKILHYDIEKAVDSAVKILGKK